MNTNRNTLKYILLVAILGVLGITVAFAVLSTNLTINTSVQNDTSVTWEVSFDEDVALNEKGTSDIGRSCGRVDVFSTSLSIGYTTLSKPGDGCEYELKIRNNGTIAAKLDSITPEMPESQDCDLNKKSDLNYEMVCHEFKYSLEIDSANLYEYILSPGSYSYALLTIEYVGDSTSTTELEQNGAMFITNWIQN